MGGSHFFRAGQYPKGGIQALLQPQHVVEPQQPSAGDTLRELQQLVDSMPDDEPTEPGAAQQLPNRAHLFAAAAAPALTPGVPHPSLHHGVGGLLNQQPQRPAAPPPAPRPLPTSQPPDQGALTVRLQQAS